MLRPGTFVKGLLSFPIARFRNPHSDSGPGTTDIVYSRFLRFLRLRNVAIPEARGPRVVAELGPGSSLGFGLAALIAGAQRYYALDLIEQASDARNLRTFDELVALFQSRASIPDGGWCARIFPFVEDFSFPKDIIPDEDLRIALDPDRLSRIRADLECHTGKFIRYLVPWHDSVSTISEKPDLIVSNSVLEHVDDLDSTYRSFAALSGDGTIMCHSIDYSSHMMTTVWNEHWKINNTVWGLARGKRHYLINRVPNEGHLRRLREHNFEVLASQKLRRVDGLTREDFAEAFQDVGTDDARTHLSFIVSRYARQSSR